MLCVDLCVNEPRVHPRARSPSPFVIIVLFVCPASLGLCSTRHPFGGVLRFDLIPRFDDYSIYVRTDSSTRYIRSIVLFLILFAPPERKPFSGVPHMVHAPRDREQCETVEHSSWLIDCYGTRYARDVWYRCSLKSRRSAVTVLNALWHGSNEPEALRNEPEALRKTRNDKTGGRGQLSSPRALPGVPAPSRRVNRDSYITVWSLARTFLWSVLEPRAVPSESKVTPCPRKSLLGVEVCQR